jgi:pyrroline-5-carboxylate reductase
MKKSKTPAQHGFIGCGRMAEIILSAMLSAKIVAPARVIVSRRSAAALKRIKSRLKVKTTTDNREAAAKVSMVWIGVKPAQAETVLKEIRPVIGPKTTVVSMMAGVPIRSLHRHLGNTVSVVRLMPNTPALLGAGATGVYFSAMVPHAVRASIKKIFGTLGEVEVLSREDLLDAVTGLSGSGPAFVYEFAEGMIQGGVKSGLSAAQARGLALQTLWGAGQMLKKSGLKPEALIRQVVSKGGTTEAGLKAMKKNRTRDGVARAVLAATRRARAIREGKK